MRRIKFYDISEILTTRELGKRFRTKIATCLNSGTSVTLDFKGIKVITNSFCDETIGKLQLEFELERIQCLITVINAQGLVKHLIEQSMKNRDVQLIPESDEEFDEFEKCPRCNQKKALPVDSARLYADGISQSNDADISEMLCLNCQYSWWD